MAPVRRALQSITSNSRKLGDLKPRERGIIKGKLIEGKSGRVIVREENRPESTVRYTLTKATKRLNQESLPRSGRPIVYTKRDETHIYSYIRRHPLTTYSEIREGYRVTFYNRTILLILRQRNIGY